MSALALVGDLGGTNARFALAERADDGTIRLFHQQVLRASDYATGALAIGRYLGDLPTERRPTRAALAAAGPVLEGEMQFTNLGWILREAELATDCAIERVHLLNDFTALGLGVELLGVDDLLTVGPELPNDANGTIGVVGAGTGFGVTAIARSGHARIALATEGGHISYAPTDDVEAEILRLLRQRHRRVSIERILSGPGLLKLHQVLCEINGVPCTVDSPIALSAAADAGDAPCGETLLRFFDIYGSAAGDFAMAFGATGGMYIGGGIAPDRIDWLKRSRFRERFEDKGRLSTLVKRIATRVIVGGQPAMLGAASLALA